MMGFTYVLTSTEFVGELTLAYDEKGLLTTFTNAAQLSELQRGALSRLFPLTYHQLTQLVGQAGSLTAKLLPPDLTFEVFWAAYDYPVKKKRAEALWEKLSTNDRIACLNSLSAYTFYLNVKGIEKCYPDTYLRGRRWEDDFKKLAKAK